MPSQALRRSIFKFPGVLHAFAVTTEYRLFPKTVTKGDCHIVHAGLPLNESCRHCSSSWRGHSLQKKNPGLPELVLTESLPTRRVPRRNPASPVIFECGLACFCANMQIEQSLRGLKEPHVKPPCPLGSLSCLAPTCRQANRSVRGKMGED